MRRCAQPMYLLMQSHQFPARLAPNLIKVAPCDPTLTATFILDELQATPQHMRAITAQAKQVPCILMTRITVFRSSQQLYVYPLISLTPGMATCRFNLCLFALSLSLHLPLHADRLAACQRLSLCSFLPDSPDGSQGLRNGLMGNEI